MEFDWLIENGLLFDGLGSPPVKAHVAIKDGVVKKIASEPIPRGCALHVIDGSGQWILPGFVDCHTHYDAEVLLDASLSESLRHGVTSVVLGSCSLGLTTGTPEVLADIFCRVEAIPYGAVRKLLEERKSWETQGEYLSHLASLRSVPTSLRSSATPLFVRTFWVSHVLSRAGSNLHGKSSKGWSGSSRKRLTSVSWASRS